MFIHFFYSVNSFSLNFTFTVLSLIPSIISDHFLCLSHVLLEAGLVTPVKKSINPLSVLGVVIVSHSSVVHKFYGWCVFALTSTARKGQRKQKRRKHCPLGGTCIRTSCFRLKGTGPRRFRQKYIFFCLNFYYFMYDFSATLIYALAF